MANAAKGKTAKAKVRKKNEKASKEARAPKAKARTARVKAKGSKGTDMPAGSSGIPKAIAQLILGRRTLWMQSKRTKRKRMPT